MKPSVIIAGIVIFLVVIVGGVVVTLSAPGGAAAYETMDGQALYSKLCAQCHGPQGTARKGGGNSYAGKRDYWNESSIVAYLANPKRYRAKMPHLRDSKKYMPPLSPSVPTAARKRIAQHVLKLMDALH